MTRKGSWVQVPHGPPINLQVKALSLWTLPTLGLRKGEALGLAWEDVDLELRYLAVRQAVKYKKGKVVVGDVKTASSRRSVNAPEQLVTTLKAHKARSAERLKAGELWVDSGLVFTTTISHFDFVGDEPRRP